MSTESDPGDDDSLQGWNPPLRNEDEVRRAVEKAFDYRGDFTIRTRDGQ